MEMFILFYFLKKEEEEERKEGRGNEKECLVIT